MKRYAVEFCRRGLNACGFGPLTLAVIYLVLYEKEVVSSLAVEQVALGIFTLSALAFVAGGMNVLYQIEHLPLMGAVLIHGGALYFAYLATYLFNGWLEEGAIPLLIFSAVFLLGYLAIWVVIFSVAKIRTKKLNQTLETKRKIKKRPSDL